MGASQGLSLVGERPGSPALLAVLAGATHLPVAAVTAAFEAAFGAAIAVGTAVLVRAAGAVAGERRGARAAWVLAGLLTGLFTVHLAAGYLANLAFAAPFIAAAVCLAVGTRRGVVAAAIALGGGGLTHPQFFLIGALVLAAVAVWSLARHERGWESDAGRVAVATVAGGAFVGAGMLAMTIGPARLAVDTSKDGFLRRAGMSDAVRHAYLERALHRWTRYVQWLALPLAALGLMRTSGFARRVLAAWTALVVLGAPVGLLTGWFPADRLITFGFSIPALAGVGVVAVWLWLERRLWLATLVAVVARRGDGIGSPDRVEPAGAVHLPARGRAGDHGRAHRRHAPSGHAARVHRGRHRHDRVVPGDPRRERAPRGDAAGSRGRRVRLRGHTRELPGRGAHRPRQRRVRRDVPPLPRRHPEGSATSRGRVRPRAVQPDAGRDVEPRPVPMVARGVRDDPGPVVAGRRPTIRSNRRRRHRSRSGRSSSLP